VGGTAGARQDGTTAPAFFVPLAILRRGDAGLVRVSADRAISFTDDKQLVLFAIVPPSYDVARGRRAATVVDVIITVGGASAVFGIVQATVFHYD
jgi:hypothetical protein